MKLYELTSDFKGLWESLEDYEGDYDTEQAWFDTLVGIEGEIEDKVENIAKMVKMLSAEVDAHKAAEKEIAARRRSKESRIEWLKQYIITSMDTVSLRKVDRPEIAVSVRATQAAVKIADEEAFIKWAQGNRDDLLKYAAPTINKAAIKQQIQDGAEIEGAELVPGRTVVIK